MGVILEARGKILLARLGAPERGNPLNRATIDGLHAALDQAEADPELRLLAIAGDARVFCSGMDFSEASQTEASDASTIRAPMERLYALFDRFSTSQVVVVALVEGPATAGGLGLVAASDVAIATPAASFQLSEILFGLLPATIAPFLVRRMGVQDPYRMALTAERMDAATALARRLVDEVVDDPQDALRRLMIRVNRAAKPDVAATKAYFRSLWIIDDATRRRAVEAISERVADPAAMQGIRRFLDQGGVPWQKP